MPGATIALAGNVLSLGETSRNQFIQEEYAVTDWLPPDSKTTALSRQQMKIPLQPGELQVKTKRLVPAGTSPAMPAFDPFLPFSGAPHAMSAMRINSDTSARNALPISTDSHDQRSTERAKKIEINSA
jgi:hypothetical protein